MRASCLFAPAAIALTILGMSAPVRAGSVVLLNNLNQPPMAASSNPFVGQSFIAGTVDQTLYGAQMQLDPTSPPTPGITLEVESRNSNGTVGATLYSNFSSSFDPTTGVVTFTANSPFELTAGTGYWLVLADPRAGGVTWDFTSQMTTNRITATACRRTTLRGSRTQTTAWETPSTTNRQTVPSSSI